MRALVPPPPSMRCKLCGGELRFKRIANRVEWLGQRNIRVRELRP